MSYDPVAPPPADGSITLAKLSNEITPLAKTFLQQATTTDAKDTLDVPAGGGSPGVVVPFTY